MNNDQALKTLIEDELGWQPHLDAADIGVAVDSGIVSLTGHVPSYAQKIAVDQTVRRIKNVRGIAENIEVRPFPVFSEADDQLAKRAANLIDWDVNLPKGAVKVQVSKGDLSLTGEVDWQYQRYAAERCVRNLRGVKGVTNQITIKPHVQPQDVKRRIENALKRQADLDAEGVHVTVEGAKVRLEGKVGAWRDRDAIERAAWAAPGVCAVDDRVTVAF